MEMTLQELLQLGGWAMWPLLIFSVASITLFLERFLFLLFHSLRVAPVKNAILEKLKDGDIAEARKVCDSFPRRNLAAPIFKAGLEVYELGEHRMEKAIDSMASKMINSIERGFDLLTALGSIAPITGFLGTVSGMIGAFQTIANAADVSAKLVAGGIFEALITTAYGLSIAIVAITAYYIFVHFSERFAANVEEAANEILGTLSFKDSATS